MIFLELVKCNICIAQYAIRSLFPPENNSVPYEWHFNKQNPTIKTLFMMAHQFKLLACLFACWQTHLVRFYSISCYYSMITIVWCFHGSKNETAKSKKILFSKCRCWEWINVNGNCSEQCEFNSYNGDFIKKILEKHIKIDDVPQETGISSKLQKFSEFSIFQCIKAIAPWIQ